MGKNKKKSKDNIAENDNEIIENQQNETKQCVTDEKADLTEKTKEEALNEQIKSLEEEIENLKDKNLRMLAEFDNFRRRTSKEKLEMMSSAGENIFKEMLPLVDDFERALNATFDIKNDDLKQLQNGIELIYNKFKKFLSDHNVSEIETQDVNFSTDLHEALTIVDAGEDQHGKIIECTRKGYKMGDKVIRYAQVVVGK